ncbi:hypothetical protein AMS68_003257 [Peltaster fructicola]|uniref:Uncharacterized protein n=1 Tax=Peltaster fructicola TaxID=286661 RepID=A0A6H0XTF7_9PEZI|nr:hypothetical protein AMS68_003257 [Peltaster fructicola]
MYTKSLVLAVMALFASTRALAMPEPSPADAAAPAATTGSQVGTLLAFSGQGYSGNSTILSIVKGSEIFCQEWFDVETRKPLPPIDSYVTANIVCFTYSGSGCTGQVTGGLAGQRNVTNIALQSLYCAF